MNVLVVAAHPDDEILGCGATMARHAAAHDNVSILIVAEGATSRIDGSSAEVRELRSAAHEAARLVGAAEPQLLGFPDNRLDTMALLDIVQAIEAVVQSVAPQIIYTHHGNDLNIDHRIVHQAVVTACRPLPGSSVRRIYGFEAPSSSEWSTSAMGPSFKPIHFVAVSDFLAAKYAALECYEMEMRPFPHPRSFEALAARAKVWGSFIGFDAAEAFETYLDIEA